MRVTPMLIAAVCCALWPSFAATQPSVAPKSPAVIAHDEGIDTRWEIAQENSFLNRKVSTMFSMPPTANVLNPVLWLGHRVSNRSFPVGSGVVIYVDDNQYLVTALHVANSCDFKPLLRFRKRWNLINWKTVAVDESHDIAVLKTDVVLDPNRIPIQYGEVAGLTFGVTGYALGYPSFPRSLRPRDLRVDHIIEAKGRPIPLAALVVANFTAGANSTYSAAYINAGFSGGAVVFPIGQNDWTIAGIITHFPAFPRPIFRNGEKTKDYVMEHTGLVGYTPLKVVESIIRKALATGKGKPATKKKKAPGKKTK